MKNGFNDRSTMTNVKTGTKGLNEVIEAPNTIFYCAVISIRRKAEDKKLKI
jgi:hypothetical protein